MFRSLTLITVRQKHHDSCREIPFVLARADELVDDHRGAVGEVAELRFPENERFGEVAAEAVLETEAACFGKRGIVNLAESLIRRKVTEREIVLLRFSIN